MVALVVAAAAIGWRWGPDLARREVLAAPTGVGRPAVVVTPTETLAPWVDSLTWATAHPLWLRVRPQVAPVQAGEWLPVVPLFMQQRRTASGSRLLVVLYAEPDAGQDGLCINLFVRLFDPGTFLHADFRELPVRPAVGLAADGPIPGSPGARYVLANLPWAREFSLSVAQADPSNPSQVLLSYTLQGAAHRIVARLRDDQGFTFCTDDGTALPIQPSRNPSTRPD